MNTCSLPSQDSSFINTLYYNIRDQNEVDNEIPYLFDYETMVQLFKALLA